MSAYFSNTVFLSAGINVGEYKADTQRRKITDIISQTVGGGRREINFMALKALRPLPYPNDS
jgi:hypothetical protein